MPRRTSQDLRQEILAASSRLFGAAGYRGTSLQDIAREVGYSKAALLYHFDSKDAILRDLMAPAITALAELDARVSALTGRRAQRAAAEGFVALAVRFRREIALLDAEIPVLLCEPEFAELDQRIDRLAGALAHEETLDARLRAFVVLAGLPSVCARFTDVSDEELNAALTAAALGAVGLTTR